ncbi:glycerol-3-phosphate acyltransferase 1-like [Zingiber officinale]|uniref:glycerol-3-phosphate acyltransferase 1-like n=1 Tax=Zingiber officinale TaxID=94328 RepID=UPI001C4BC1C4|nr:glycerol-3-phosphate acyltransferase 1-like [Zingiber officinale]
MRIMAFVTFCGLRTGDLRLIARTVLPKIFLENLHLHACEVLKGRRAVVLTTLPRLMVEGFLKEYLEVGEVVGAELQVVKGCYFTGVISWPDKQRALRDMVKAGVAIVNLSNVHHHQLSAKKIYVMGEEESRSESSKMPRNKYPKPLVFHDGRLAFLPTPCEMMAFFMWIPVAIPLAVFRIAMGIVFPYKISIFIAAVTGIRFRRAGDGKANGEKKGVVYVCTHRTLLDPVMLCSALERTVPAVTYSLSRVSEALASMRTVRLTRDRGRDAATMRRLLAVEGGLAVCPEGTTCQEPYLLRFSPLFAEVAEEVVPVALDARVGMLYATKASSSQPNGGVGGDGTNSILESSLVVRSIGIEFLKLNMRDFGESCNHSADSRE